MEWLLLTDEQLLEEEVEEVRLALDGLVEEVLELFSAVKDDPAIAPKTAEALSEFRDRADPPQDGPKEEGEVVSALM